MIKGIQENFSIANMEEKNEGNKVDEILFIYYILACVIFNSVIKVIFVDCTLISSPPPKKDLLLKI